MNFYQRANLSMGLAVILGLELAITQWFRDNTAQGLRTFLPWVDEFVWIAFLFMFRMKVTIDDHYHFKKPNAGSPQPTKIVLFVDFFLFSIASFLFVVTAIFAMNFDVSAWFFIASLIVATVWAAVHAKTPYGEFVAAWIPLNIVYAVVLLMLVFEWPFGKPWWMYAALFVLLIVDFMVSKTLRNMPAVD